MAYEALKDTIFLLGNALGYISQLRRREILKVINPEQVDLAGENHFLSSAPNLFGPGFEKVMMEQAESVKLLEAAKPGPSSRKPFFREAAPLYPREAAASPDSGQGRTSCQWPRSGLPTTESFSELGQCSNNKNSLFDKFKKLHSTRGGISTRSGKEENSCWQVSTVPWQLVKVTRDSWVLNTVMEYGIDFLVNPSQHTRPRVGVLPPAEQHLLQLEIQKLLCKGAITEVAAKEAGRASTRDCS